MAGVRLLLSKDGAESRALAGPLDAANVERQGLEKAVLEQARLAEYTGTSIAAFRATYPVLFERYNAAGFADRFTLTAPLRSRITFSPHNLLSKSPWRDDFDAVLLHDALHRRRNGTMDADGEAEFLREGGQEADQFVGDGMLDSFDVVTLVSDLDKAYGISISGVDIVPENFQNIAAIEKLLQKYVKP